MAQTARHTISRSWAGVKREEGNPCPLSRPPMAPNRWDITSEARQGGEGGVFAHHPSQSRQLEKPGGCTGGRVAPSAAWPALLKTLQRVCRLHAAVGVPVSS